MAEIQTNIRRKPIQLKDQERIQMKLLSPLTGGFFRKCKRRGKEDYENTGRGIDGRELAQYEMAIRKAVDRENHLGMEDGKSFDLMEECFDGSPSIQRKVEHGRISVENTGGALYGCTTLILKEELEDWEMKELCEYIAGQYSDGWGECFEQRDIPAEGGIINVYFDFLESPDFQIESAVIKNPDLEKQKDSISESEKWTLPEAAIPCLSAKSPRPKLPLVRYQRKNDPGGQKKKPKQTKGR